MKKTLLAISALFLLTVLGLLAQESWQDRQRTLAEARRTLQNLTLTLEAQTAYGIKATDLLLTEIIETVMQHRHWERDHYEDINDLLARRLQFAANTINLAYMNTQGRVVYAARDREQLAKLDFSDRPYFRVHRGNPEAGLYFDLPTPSRFNNQPFIALSRRVNDAAGGFAGVVVAIIEPERLEDFYHSLDMGRQGVITLLRDDGQILIREPPQEGSSQLEPDLETQLWEHLARTPHGLLEHLDDPGVALYGAYRRVGRFPLVLLVTFSSDDVLEGWQRGLWHKALFGGGITLAVLILSGLLLGQLRHQADSERQLRQQALVLEQMSDALLVTDLQGRLVDWNRAAERLFGHSRAQVLGRRPDFLLGPVQAQVLPRQIREGVRQQGIWTGELTLQKANGSGVECDMVTVPLLDGNARMMATITVLRDITERKRVEQLKSEFVSTVSHELRTPLTSIRGSLGLVTSGAAGPLPPKASQLLTIALRNSQRLVALVNDILDIQKIESGRLDFQLEAMDLINLVEQAMEANQAYAQLYEVRFELMERPAFAPVRGDQARLMQVMTNLLSNAAKFSPQGGRVELAVTVDEDRYRVTVRDFGPGIPEAFRPRVFQKFAQADGSSTRRRPGTGLGLAISRAIVERHWGSIGFETGDEGSCFHFELPALGAASPALSRAVGA